MTRYFEIEQRDGAARIGKLLLSPETRTPCLLHTAELGNIEKPGAIVDAGSLWVEEASELEERIKHIREKAGEGSLIILPHQAYPLNAPFKRAMPSDNGPTGLLLRSREDPGKSDLYVMEGAGSLENNPRKFMETLLDIKSRIPADTALYAPNLALPENAAMLVYLGIDVLDDTRAEIAAYSDIYLTSAGRFYLDSLSELPCRCNACASISLEELKSLPKAERAKTLAAHNRNALLAELALVREKIRANSLREYMEGQCRVKPWLTALLRLADFEYNYLEGQVPAFRQTELLANSGETLSRVEVVRFAKRIQERYTPPELDILLLLPCSAKKPYSISQSHQKFALALGKYRKFVHEVIITSPLGIVPRELELSYPAAHYDTAVTGHWDAEEKAWVSGCLENYLRKHRYSAVVAHVEGPYREICEMAAERLGIEVIYTATENPTSSEALYKLKTTIEKLALGKKSRNAEEAKVDFLRAIAAYQFGEPGKTLIPPGAVVKARFPKYQLFANKEQLATLIPQYGMLALTLKGGELIAKTGKYSVKIDDFVPRGSILAPGVVEADQQIRPNDEVIVVGKKALCVGRALMSGKEMQESTRGVSIALRHVKKLGEN